jgi:hypothetical protein
MKVTATHLQFRRASCFGISFLILSLTTGCLIIPVDYHDAGVRHNVNTQTGDSLQPDVTTKEEVFLALGEPDFVSEDGQRLGYAWTKVKAVIIWGSYGGGGGEELKRSYILDVSFGSSNRVSQVRVLKDWGAEVSPSNDLISLSGNKSAPAAKQRK